MPVINWVGVLAAWIASWLVHGLWYMPFGRPWMRALGWTQTDMQTPDGHRRMPAGAMLVSLAAELLMTLSRLSRNQTG